MALIGNPMDFDRIRQKYESLVYPQGRTQDTNFNRVRDSYSSLLSDPGIDPLTGQPTNMDVLAGQGSQTFSQDATQAGEQVQLRFNPVTGQTETIIPEYMGGFRSDQQDFLPQGGGFETIYDVDQGRIDPITGTVKADPIVTDVNTGQTTSLLARDSRDGRDKAVTKPDNYNFVGGKFVNTDSLNEDGSIGFGIHGMIPGFLGAPGQIARAITSPARQLATLQNISAMNMDYTGKAPSGYENKAALDIANLARNVQNRAEKSGDVETAVDAAKMASGYYGLSRDTAQENMDAAKEEAEANESTGIVDAIGDFFGGLFGGDKGKENGKQDNGSTGQSIGGFGEADANRESQRGNY